MERSVKQVLFPAASIPKLTRVAAYSRVSSGKDAMLHSLSAQISYYSNLIQNHKGWQYVGVYADEALTGTKDNREKFQQMLADCRAGKIDMVITKSISRFARNTITLLESVRELKALGVDVFFEEQNIHTMSADGELMITILASYAQEESLSASENMKWRIRKGFERGEMINLRFLYGYSIKKGVVTVDPAQAEIVREIFRRFNDGESMGGIAADLNARGMRGSLGGEWCQQRIHDVVTNEKYLGNALLQKTFVNNHLEKKQIKNRGELPQYYAEGTHEAIIDSETFAKAQERIEALRLAAEERPKPTRSAFTGKICCAKCGKNYKRGRHGKRSFWNCSTYLSKGAKTCQCSQIPEPLLYSITAEVLGLTEFDPDAFESKITVIEAHGDNTLVFCFTDGTQAVKRWQHRSRSESWTPEMRESARQKAKQQVLPDRGWHGYFQKTER
jgi:site-specific DNA recombinase